MTIPQAISIADYTYELPAKRIAEFPAEPRDSSRLLVYDPAEGLPYGDIFSKLPDYLPANSLIYFNETRVVQARLIFHKESGARIEIFCLSPVTPGPLAEQAFASLGPVIWKTYVGNAKRWKTGTLKMPFQTGKGQTGNLTAEITGRNGNTFFVRFAWEPMGLTFSDVLEATGKIPLPPYIRRDVLPGDRITYQTVYARTNGSVAAPTAGLHFTDNIINELKNKNIQPQQLVLHVGAGTFKPVESDDVSNHTMHTEEIIVSRKTIEALAEGINQPKIVVGTTSVRTLESLYQTGRKLTEGIPFEKAVHTCQWDPYGSARPEPVQAIEAIMRHMKKHNLESLNGSTNLMIVPGYRFMLTDLLLTNFHQPHSTLLLLVAAFCGEGWKKAYQYALDNGFRFLSYGDACLFAKA
jgi:S-adenosylmethionine:tRNA ribosyltransferase-isomerase